MMNSPAIYIYGCATCGRHSAKILRAKNKLGATVIDTRTNLFELPKHIEYLERAGMGASNYRAIVVEQDGKLITLLSEWQC